MRVRLGTLIFIIAASSLLVSCFTTDIGIQVPKGYSLVHLAGLDGAILKPNGWHFYTGGTSNSVVYAITKEPVTATNGYLTGFRLQFIPAVSKITHVKPSEYANTVLADYPKLRVITKCLDCEYATGQGDVKQQEWIVDQTVNVSGSSVICRVGINTMAIDRLDLLVVLIYGTPKEEWGVNESIYQTVRKKIRILGSHPGK